MRPAAQYLRVSGDQQLHSLPAQRAKIADFAAAHGFEIVRTYEDRGKSGLRLKGRTALQGLLADVLGGEPPFEAILIQDVSRWGRFQDPDEAAHYEYVCRAAGLQVRYCDEPFDAVPNQTGDLSKAMRRWMAAEYSRALSRRIRASHYRYARQGFKMGGAAGYGLRRAIVGEDGEIKAVLEHGQRRLLREDRIIYIPGPAHEVETVRRIFRLLLEDGLHAKAIAALLNAEGVTGEAGRPWAPWTIGALLQNPKYAGVYRFGRRPRTLEGGRIDAPPEEVLLVENALAPIVPAHWIAAATAKRHKRMLFLPRHEILRRLRQHAASGSPVTRAAVGANPALPSAQTCAKHFGPWPRVCARLRCYPRILSGRIDRYRPGADAASRPEPEPPMSTSYTAFVGPAQIAAGDLETVALAAHAAQDRQSEMPLVFDDATGLVVDLDLRGGPDTVLQRLPQPASSAEGDTPRSRGRPKLGVTAREVTLLPRHWAWLQTQPGGASAALRRLVEQAQQDNAEVDARRIAQTATYKVMYALAGHLAGYEAALRALYADDAARFGEYIEAWPRDISAYVRRLAEGAFSGMR